MAIKAYLNTKFMANKSILTQLVLMTLAGLQKTLTIANNFTI
jgi:hypothetical protein